MSEHQVIRRLPGPWQPQVLPVVHDAVLRVARFEDELLRCRDGRFRIEVEGRSPATLAAGEFFVVPRRVRHRPVAGVPAHALMISVRRRCGTARL